MMGAGTHHELVAVQHMFIQLLCAAPQALLDIVVIVIQEHTTAPLLPRRRPHRATIFGAACSSISVCAVLLCLPSRCLLPPFLCSFGFFFRLNLRLDLQLRVDIILRDAIVGSAIICAGSSRSGSSDWDL